MIKKKNEIRSAIGNRGMMIYTPDQTQVCIAYDLNGDSYSIRNEPAEFWKAREELFHINYHDKYTPKEIRNLIIRLIVEFMTAGFLPTILREMSNLLPRQIVGISFFSYALIYILEFSIFKGLKRRKSERGRMLLRWRGALNKAINAFEKNGRVPTFDEVEKASMYRSDRYCHIDSYEISGILFTFASISFFMPTVRLQIMSIPILIFITILACKTSLFGVLRLTYVAPPEPYELKIACNLVDFWFSVSYKDSPTMR